MSIQGLCGGSFAIAFKVHGRRVKIVHAVLQGIVHKVVDLRLVDMRTSVLTFYDRPTHTSIAKKTDTVIVAGHFTVGNGSALRIVISQHPRRASSYSKDSSAKSGFLQKLSSVHIHFLT